jgi:hypothetical protein
MQLPWNERRGGNANEREDGARETEVGQDDEAAEHERGDEKNDRRALDAVGPRR